jgi:hypothetical protein
MQKKKKKKSQDELAHGHLINNQSSRLIFNQEDRTEWQK